MSYQPATHTTTDRRLGRLPSGRTLTTTVHRYEGGPGPTVYVQAAQHGIELNGPAALRRLNDRLVDAALAGTVVVVPLANPPAFDHRSYTAPPEYDALNPNLNRVWPGDPDGSLHERMADRLWELVTDADAVVDLHTGTADMLEHVRFGEGDDRARALAEAFGTDHLLADPGDGTDGGGDGTDRSGAKLRTAAARADIPAITAELANSRTVSPPAAETGADGVWNVLAALDVRQPAPSTAAERTLLRDDRETTVAAAPGLFELRPDVRVGDHLRAGEELGTIHDPSTFERRRTVTVEEAGVAYSLTREAVVFVGERLAAVASD